jgi:hypothetical protein
LQRCAAHSPYFGMTPLESAFDGGDLAIEPLLLGP